MAFLDNEGLKRFWENLALKLSNKVDKVEGKGLSTNDYTTTEKAKLASAVTEEIFNEEISKRPTAYDTRKTEPLTIEWDGVIGEREWFVMDEDIDRATLSVKVSDATPSYQEIMAGTILTNTKTEEIPVEQFQTMAFGSSTVAFGENDEGFFCVVDPADLAEEEERFTHGLWLTIQDDRVENKTFVTRLFLPSVATGERKTLDPKYLPDTVVTQEVFNEEINKRPIAYDTRKTEELTIEWDGEIGERDTLDFMGLTLVKMTNVTPSYEELCAATFDLVYPEELKDFILPPFVSDGTSQGFPFIGVGDSGCSTAYCMVFPNDCTIEGAFCPKGLYLTKIVASEEDVLFVKSVYFPSVATGELVQMDPALVDAEWYAGQTEVVTGPLTVEWDGVIGDRETNNFMYQTYVKLSDVTPTYEEITQAEIYAHLPAIGIEKLESLNFMDARGDGLPLVAVDNGTETPACLFIFDEFEMEGMSFNKGIYSFYMEGDEKTYMTKLHLPSVTTGELKTIDPKYLPDTVAYKSDIVPQVQADWNQTDDTAVDYIKNKPQELPEDDLLVWLNEENVIEPVASTTGELYTTNNNEIYVL